MRKHLQKLSKVFLGVAMMFQTLGVLSAFAAELEVDHQNKVMIGLDQTHMWSSDNGNTWRIGNENQRFLGNIMDAYPKLEGAAAEQFQIDEAQRVQNQKKVIGYFANWQGDKTDVFPNHPSHADVPDLLDGQGYDPVNVPMDKLTHVNYAFIVIDDNGLPILQDPRVDTLDENGAGRNYIGQLARLTRENDVTFMMSVGGGTHSLEGYFDIATETPEKIDAFTDALIEMMLEFEFDGIDLNWEFPENDDQKRPLCHTHSTIT